MAKNIIILITAFIIISLSGCAAIQRSQVAAKAKSSMIGMSKQQILQCMGVANGMQNVGTTEVWKYYSGGAYSSSINMYTSGQNTQDQFSYGTIHSSARSCEINVVFTNDKVSNVLYSGNTGGILSRGEQCGYAVSNCVQ